MYQNIGREARGSEFSLGAHTDWAFGRLTLRPAVALTWRSSRSNAFRFGVLADEATATRPAYSPEAGIDAKLGLYGSYALTRHWRLLAGVGFNLDRFTAFRADNPFVYWWFAFNATPHVAAMLWEGKEDRMVDHLLTAMVADPRSISAEDKAEIVRGLRTPGGLHGSFGWYRDSLRTAQQTVDALSGRVLGVPLLALNGQYGHPGVREQFDGLVATVEGTTIPGAGHLIAEEQPAAVVAEIVAFGRRHAGRLAAAPA